MIVSGNLHPCSSKVFRFGAISIQSNQSSQSSFFRVVQLFNFKVVIHSKFNFSLIRRKFILGHLQTLNSVRPFLIMFLSIESLRTSTLRDVKVCVFYAISSSISFKIKLSSVIISRSSREMTLLSFSLMKSRNTVLVLWDNFLLD